MNLAHGFGSLTINDESDLVSSLNIFEDVHRDVSLTGGRDLPIAPTSISESGPYEFPFPVKQGSYIHFPSIRLCVEAKIVKSDGSDITSDTVSTVNLVIPSLFESCSVEIGGRKVQELSSDNFGYKQYIETVLSYGFDASRSHVRAGLFTIDSPGVMEKFTDWTATSPLKIRHSWIEGSKIIQGSTIVVSDFMSCDKFFPSTNQLTVKLTRGSDDFVLMQASDDTESYKIKILDIKLYARYVDINPSILLKHNKMFETRPQSFPIIRSEIKTFAQAPGSKVFNIHNAYQGNLPKTVVMTFISTDRYSGHKNKNSYYFKNMSLSYASMSLNGERIPADPYTPNFKSGRFMREYRALFDDLGIQHENSGIGVSPDRYGDGFFFLSFSDVPDKCYHAHLHPGKTGSISFGLKFDSAPTEAFTVMLFATYDTVLIIDNKFNNHAYYV